MIVNLLKAGLGILDVLYRFGNFFRVGKLMALSICCFLGGLILVRLFTVPYFFPEIVEIECVLPLMAAILIFKCTEGAGVGDYSSRRRGGEKPPNRPRPLGSFDTHVRWQPVTQSARSRRYYEKIEDCEQSRFK